MKKIYFISSNDTIPSYFIFPIIKNKIKLFEMGYQIKILKNLNTIDKLDCDIICIQSKPIINLLSESSWVFKENGPTISFLKKIRQKVDKIIWLDDSDSTSITHFEVMPFVDFYLKKQILKDKNFYNKDYYGGRIFSDYYNKNFNVVDKNPIKKQYKLEREYFDKLQVSWNIGLGNTQSAFSLQNYISKYIPQIKKTNYDFKYEKLNNNRPIDIFLRTSSNLARESIAFHRKKLVSELQNILRSSELNGIINEYFKIKKLIDMNVIKKISKKVSNLEYKYLLKNSKIMPSPFGWGEIGARDFEAFFNGCLVIKPDMEYMETWPNYFIKYKTYVPCKLDFSDLEDNIKYYIKNTDIRLQIVENSQKLLKEIYSENGMNNFCSRFKKLIGEK